MTSFFTNSRKKNHLFYVFVKHQFGVEGIFVTSLTGRINVRKMIACNGRQATFLKHWPHDQLQVVTLTSFVANSLGPIKSMWTEVLVDRMNFKVDNRIKRRILIEDYKPEHVLNSAIKLKEYNGDPDSCMLKID